LLKKLGVEGTVILFVEIKSDGTVGEVEVKKSLKAGKGGLDEAAIKAVKKWKFEPAKNAGKPITVWVNLPITFTLH
jgi:protein TonB